MVSNTANTFDYIASNPSMQNKLLGKDSPLSEDSKSRLFNSLVNRETNAVGKPIAEFAYTTLIGEGIGFVGGKVLSWAAGKAVAKGVKMIENSTSIASPVINETVTGFTKHGLNQSINRGFKSSDILNIIRNGTKEISKGRFGMQTKFKLGDNTVVVNEKGKIITVFSGNKSANGFLTPY
jgi:hypothetical protein